MRWLPEVRKALDHLLATKNKEKIAVFDADGTFWHSDFGDGFFEFQVKNQLAPGLKGISDPWAYYREFEERDPAACYGWLAQINAGVKEEELRKQAKEFYLQSGRDLIQPKMKSLVNELKKKDFEIWIISASIRWVIESSMKDLGLEPSHLIATEVKVSSGTLTDEVVTPVPYQGGKRYWIEKKVGEPLLVAGNSMGDLEMLSMAKELPLVVVYKPHLPQIENSEKKLIEEAKKRNWSIQIFQQ